MTDDSNPPNPTCPPTLNAALLERALQQALPPPELPAGFRSRLMARVQGEQMAELESRRLELAQEYERQRQQLRADYVSLRRDRLAMIVASAFAAGVCVSVFLPWLYSAVGSADSLNLGLTALAIMLALWAGTWVESFGAPKLPGLNDS